MLSLKYSQIYHSKYMLLSQVRDGWSAHGGVCGSDACIRLHAAVIIVEENNIGQYTAAAIDDPRAANKTLYLAPPANSWWSQNELIELYEKLSGKTVKRNPVSKEAQRRKIDEESEHLSIVYARHIACVHTYKARLSAMQLGRKILMFP